MSSIFCYLCCSDAAKENIVPLPEYDVFKDAAFQQPQRSRSSTLVSGQGQGQSAGGVAATGVQNWEALVSDGLLCAVATRCRVVRLLRLRIRPTAAALVILTVRWRTGRCVTLKLYCCCS
jgi:hypothetical protein